MIGSRPARWFCLFVAALAGGCSTGSTRQTDAGDGPAKADVTTDVAFDSTDHAGDVVPPEPDVVSPDTGVDGGGDVTASETAPEGVDAPPEAPLGGGDAGPDSVPASGGAGCSTSTECGAGAWCNPGSSRCQGRSQPALRGFMKDVFPTINDVCQSCHLHEGTGAILGTSGVPLIFDGTPYDSWKNLQAGGTDCRDGTARRVCVDEPRLSLFARKPLQLANDPAPANNAVVIYHDWNDPGLQVTLEWIAQGAGFDGEKVSADGGSDGRGDASPGGRDADPAEAAPAPPPCDRTADPKIDGCVIDEQYAVFASPSGVDVTATGTRKAPFGTLAAALAAAKAAGKRVLACSGTYAESLTIGAGLDGASLFGGLDCATWRYSGQPLHLRPTAQGPAIRIDALTVGATLGDFDALAKSGVAPGESSVAALVTNSKGVLFVRTTLAAGSGADGPAGAAALTGDARDTGSSPVGKIGGAFFTGDPAFPVMGSIGYGGDRSCVGGLHSYGGMGAAWVTPAQGAPGMPAASSPWYGVGGSSASTSPGSSCNIGNRGAAGAKGLPGAGARGTGALSVAGWQGLSGLAGAAGLVGQGGGGGGAGEGTMDDAFTASGCSAFYLAGSGGGAGGCPGGGGPGGGAGGASIALVSVGSEVTLVECSLVSGGGGKGGAGAPGGVGQGGYAGGPWGYREPFSPQCSKMPSFCNGGDGGDGGPGGPGGGGQGGHSLGVAYTGTRPTMTNTKATPGVAGPAGKGGADTGPTYDGVAGVSASALNQWGDQSIDTRPPGVVAPSPVGVSCGVIDVTWAAVTDDSNGPVFYEICRSTTAGACLQQAGGARQSLGQKTSFEVKSLVPGTTYYFVVRASDGFSNTSLSAEVSVTTPIAVDADPPTVPSSARVTDTSARSLTVSWGAGADDCTPPSMLTYQLCASTSATGCDGTSWTTSLESAKGAQTATVTGLTPNTSYYVFVRAADGTGKTSLGASTAGQTSHSFADVVTVLTTCNNSCHKTNGQAVPTDYSVLTNPANKGGITHCLPLVSTDQLPWDSFIYSIATGSACGSGPMPATYKDAAILESWLRAGAPND
jgi:hypothetical protein